MKGKSCTGCMYYSSNLKSKSKNPTCVGFSKSHQNLSSSIIGETELEASEKGYSLKDFIYACAGYSVYLDNKDSSADQRDKIAKLPLCLGLEMSIDIEPKTADGHAPAPAQKNYECEQAIPQRSYKPPSTTKEEYFKRFVRNTELVASRVARNLCRVGNYAKDTIDDILRRQK